MLIRTRVDMLDGDKILTPEQINDLLEIFRGAQEYIRADIGREEKKTRKKD